MKQVENNYVVEYSHQGLDNVSGNNYDDSEKDVSTRSSRSGHQRDSPPLLIQKPNELESLRAEITALKAENDLLRMSLNQQHLLFKQFQTDYKTREKLVNEELKNLRKKIFFLLKKSVVNNYTTDDDDDDDEPSADEKVIHF